MSLIRKHGAVLQAWACLDLVENADSHTTAQNNSRSYLGLYRQIALAEAAIRKTCRKKIEGRMSKHRICIVF